MPPYPFVVNPHPFRGGTAHGGSFFHAYCIAARVAPFAQAPAISSGAHLTTTTRKGQPGWHRPLITHGEARSGHVIGRETTPRGSG
jgi:hypothetical protein